MIESLKEKLAELVADPWADQAEVEAAQKALEAAQVEQQPLAPASDATKADFDELVSFAAKLGIDPSQVARLHSQVELVIKEQVNTKAGMFALKCQIEAHYMRRRIKETQIYANGTAWAIEQLDKPATPPLEPRNGKKSK